MSIKATWGTSDPEEYLVGHQMTVTTPDEVDLLIARLGDPNASAASLVHANRPTVIDTEGYFGAAGSEVVDHSVDVCVRDQFGYLIYSSPEHDHAYATAVGDPLSPKAISDQSEFAAGTGLPLETLAAALKEFLLTAQRPSCVQWQDA